MFSHRSCGLNQNTILFLIDFFSRAVYETMCKYIVGPDRPQMAIWRIPMERWLTKAKNTHSE
jgi:hypothetical protein